MSVNSVSTGSGNCLNRCWLIVGRNLGNYFSEIRIKYKNFPFMKSIWKNTPSLLCSEMFVYACIYKCIHTCASIPDENWFMSWHVACSAPSHYLNQSWQIVGWPLVATPAKLESNTKLKYIFWDQIPHLFYDFTCFIYAFTCTYLREKCVEYVGNDLTPYLYTVLASSSHCHTRVSILGQHWSR